MKYLYGAAVQGIQQFIFQTNKLYDIVGASELVERICTTEFSEMLSAWHITDYELVIAAAGNIKCVFSRREDCECMVRDFPRRVMTLAPGITISQAVVELTGDFPSCITRLEEQLKVARNKPEPSLLVGTLGMERSGATGLPLRFFPDEKGEMDASTYAKHRSSNTRKLCEKSFGREVKHDQVAYDLRYLHNGSNWIAVVHADGNSLGQVVQTLGHDAERFSRFSRLLGQATQAAAQAAYMAVWGNKAKEDGVIPIRPVVLGGDDLTVIIRGDLAFRYTEEFMRQFRHYTHQGEMGELLREVFPQDAALTACAGIAYIKVNYPFYYAYHLAEQLCDAAKEVSRKMPRDGSPVRSSLMIHRVGDTYVRSYREITMRELTPHEKHSFRYGPYFLEGECPEGYATTTQLRDWASLLGQEEGVKNGLRQWLSLMHDNMEMAQQHLQRLKDMNKVNNWSRGLIDELTYPAERRDGCAYAAYDAMLLHGIDSTSGSRKDTPAS